MKYLSKLYISFLAVVSLALSKDTQIDPLLEDSVTYYLTEEFTVSKDVEVSHFVSYNNLELFPIEIQFKLLSYLPDHTDLLAFACTNKDVLNIVEEYLRSCIADIDPLFPKLKTPWLATYAFHGTLLNFFKTYEQQVQGVENVNSVLAQFSKFRGFCKEQDLPHAKLFQLLQDFSTAQNEKDILNNYRQFKEELSIQIQGQQQPASELALSLEIFPTVIKQFVAFPPSEGARSDNIKKISIALIFQGHAHFLHQMLSSLSPALINMIILDLAGDNYDGLFEEPCRREIFYLLNYLSQKADPFAINFLRTIDPNCCKEFVEIGEELEQPIIGLSFMLGNRSWFQYD